MIEQRVQKKIIDYLLSNGAYVAKTIVTNKKGVPDLLVCYKGLFIAIEVKATGKRNNTSKLQDYNLAQITKAGGYSLVADDVSQVKDLIERIENVKDCRS